jgi:hypothetical protein
MAAPAGITPLGARHPWVCDAATPVVGGVSVVVVVADVVVGRSAVGRGANAESCEHAASELMATAAPTRTRARMMRPMIAL